MRYIYVINPITLEVTKTSIDIRLTNDELNDEYGSCWFPTRALAEEEVAVILHELDD